MIKFPLSGRAKHRRWLRPGCSSGPITRPMTSTSRNRWLDSLHFHLVLLTKPTLLHGTVQFETCNLNNIRCIRKLTPSLAQRDRRRLRKFASKGSTRAWLPPDALQGASNRQAPLQLSGIASSESKSFRNLRSFPSPRRHSSTLATLGFSSQFSGALPSVSGQPASMGLVEARDSRGRD